MNKNPVKYQEKILKALGGVMDDFYLGGGSALSLFYFHHRLSFDLDFFTQKFSRSRVIKIIAELSGKLNRRVELIGEETRKTRARMMVYLIRFTGKESCKIDFVEDYLRLLKPPRPVNGIPVSSLEDIYLRKIYAVTGATAVTNTVGRKETLGGRQEAKDFYDLYCLSQAFMKLSVFAARFCDSVGKEGLIQWFRRYPRLEIKGGLSDLKIEGKIDYQEMERHFRKEIDRLLEKEVRFIR